MYDTTGRVPFRDRLIYFYKRQEYLIRPVIRFAVSLAVLLLLRKHLGSHGPAGALLESTLLNVILALVCSMIPPGYTAGIMALVMIWDLYSLSLEATAVCAALLLLCILLYFRFSPGDTIILLLTPIAFEANLHLALPVIAGLLFGPGAAVPIVFGLLFTKYILLVEENLPALTAETGLAAGERMIANFRSLVDGMMQDKSMMILAAALAVTVLVICFLRHLIIPHAWTIAISAGCVVEMLILLMGDMRLGTQIDLNRAIIGIVVAFVLGQLIRIFVFHVDYLHIETVQFEDEDYVYYVKAVPKVTAPYPMVPDGETGGVPDEFAPGMDPGN